MKPALCKRELKIVRALAEVLLSLDANHKEMDELVPLIDDHLAHLTKDTRFGWRVCLWLLEIVAFFYYGKRKLMSSMDAQLRTRYIEAWHHTHWSVKRTLKRFMEAIIFMNYYALPDVEKRIGYQPVYKEPSSTRDFPSSNLIREFPSEDVELDVDVCVVGSGAGGAFAAMALAKAGRSVVILEEGGFFDVNDYGCDAVTMTKKLYRAGGLVNTFGWPAILVPLGRCVGGTTVINSGTCFRTPPKVFKWWADRYGLTGWSPERLDSYYKQVEDLLQVEPSRDEVQNAAGKIFARGAKTLGIDVEPIRRNATGCSGSGICCWGCPTNAKKSVNLNAIPLAMQAGAKVYTRCRAEKIVYRRTHVTEVLARFIDPVSRTRGPCMRVKAKAVIASCGTLHTPVLFGRSDIPNASRQLGRNLTLHPASKVFGLFDEEVCGWRGIPQGYFSDALVEEGVKLEGVFLPPAFTASTILLNGKAHREVMNHYKNLAVFGMMVSDTVRGMVVRGISGHSISIYNINKEDLPKYQRGLTHLAECLFAAGAKKVFPGIHTLPVVTREEGAGAIATLKLRSKDLDLQAFHPLGTCRMGADPRDAVLDPNGRVYGLDNLFVADGSIFPTSLGVNPQMTIMAAALKIADHVNKEYL